MGNPRLGLSKKTFFEKSIFNLADFMFKSLIFSLE